MPPRSPKRTSRLQSSTTHKTVRRSDSGGIDIPLNWLKSGIGVLLLPCCIVATQSFLSAFGETSAKTLLIQSAELWFFFIGVILWLIYFFGLPRPLFLYVLGHELTHAFFVLLCGGKISEFKVKSGGVYSYFRCYIVSFIDNQKWCSRLKIKLILKNIY